MASSKEGINTPSFKKQLATILFGQTLAPCCPLSASFVMELLALSAAAEQRTSTNVRNSREKRCSWKGSWLANERTSFLGASSLAANLHKQYEDPAFRPPPGCAMAAKYLMEISADREL